MVLLRVSTSKFVSMLRDFGLVCHNTTTPPGGTHNSLAEVGSELAIIGPVTEQNRCVWDYFKNGGLFYRFHLRRYEDSSFLVEDVPLFSSIGTQMTWTGIDLDLCYKVKLTFDHGPVTVPSVHVVPPIEKVFNDRLWTMSVIQLRRICSTLKLKTTGNKPALVSRIFERAACSQFLITW